MKHIPKSSSSSSSNLLVTKYGKARFYEKPVGRRPGDGPGVKRFNPNWVVRFHVGGDSWELNAGKTYPVLGGLGPVKAWAELVMRARWEAAHAGKLEAFEALIRPSKAVSVAELLRVYLQHTPPNKSGYAKNAARLRMMMEEVSGLDAEEIDVSEEWFSAVRVREWARMRQEYFRRGWSEKWAAPMAPADAWATLRAELRAGKLPGLDKTEVMLCNTTILGYLRSAKTVFANSGEYLPGLKLPELREFLGCSIDVAVPEGHREIPGDVLGRILQEAPRLRVVSPKVWLFNELAAWTAARPITILRLGREALRVNADGSGVVSLPTTKRGNPVMWPVPAEVVDVALAVATEGSLVGTNGERTYRASNDWLTGLGLVGTKKISIYRHARLQQMREHGGVELAAAAGGHTSTAMVEKKYTEGLRAMPMLEPLVRKAG